jgi:uncharacterized protein YegP (UPF0339 family)
MQYQKYKDTNGKWRWRLIHLSNGKTIADSGEGYSNESDCDHGISLAKSSSTAPVVKLS